MLFLQLFSASIFFSQGQGVAPYSLQNCVVHGKWSKMIKVLCYRQNLSQVPCHLPWNVSSLDLSENRIASLRQSDFSKLTLLQFLNISQNQIHLIEEGTFTHTSSLKILNLTSNQLRVLSSSMFDGLGNLTVLLLRKNNIDRIDPSAFAHLMKLKVIDLSSNKLHSLNALDVVFKVKSLEKLHIRENNITNFTTKDIVNVPMWLRELDASHNPNSFIDVATDALYRLLSLDLSFSGTHSHITWIIQDPCFLKGLKRLYLGGIFMTSLDILAVVQKLNCSLLEEIHLNELNLTDSDKLIEKICLWHQNVKTLNLQGNKFESIKGIVFENCTHLWHLDLSHNRLKAVPCISFQPLNSLQSLSLANNEFTATSGALDNPPFILLKSLKYLSLNSQRHKGLLNFPSNFLKGLDSIVRIHAGNLPITDLDPATFSYTPMLQELDLSSNPINPISPALLQPGPKLTELHLNKIGLQSLDFVLHVNFSKLAILRVSGNKLNVIELKHIRALPYLTFLDLRQNPFTCSCDNRMFLSWSLHDLKTQVLYFYQYTCAFPLASKGRKLWAFHTSSCTVNHEFILFVTNTTTIILLMIVCICFRWRWQGIYAYHLLLAYIHDKRYKRMRQHTKYNYDAFVSYNTHDQEWVINELLPTLEDKYHWKLCLHYRDFEPGKCILKNIVENIYASRKTICVITHHYLESEWCSKEIQVASFRLFDEHKDVLILIFLEHIPSDSLSSYHRMRKLVKKKTYLMWPQDEMEIPLFWCKLNMALKTSEGKDDEDPILSGIIPDED
uniref:TIR domain-containing protein n=1 Tax=Chelonoidis abingdonii TaxID=106734 RepID=A0A8C0H4X2_CHEAB